MADYSLREVMEDTTAFFNNQLVCYDDDVVETITSLWWSDRLIEVRPKRGSQEQACKFFEVLVYNLVLAGDEALAFPMDKAAIEFQTNRYNRLGLTHNVTKYPGRLAKAGLLELEKGSLESRKRTTLRAAGELGHLVNTLRPKMHLIGNQMEPVEVRKEHRRIDYNDTPDTNIWRQTLNSHAELMSGVGVAFTPQGTGAPLTIPSQNLSYRRLFSRGSWDCGGRLYCNSVQGLRRKSAPERQTITFDGSATVEPDYSGQHPRILYLLEGTPAADDLDMYSAWSGVKLSAKAKSISREDRRDLAKFLMLAALNAKDAKDACGAAKKKVEKEPENPKIPMRDYMRLYDAMLDHHAAIAHHFSSDIGIRLQRLDSDIMLLVMAEMTTRGLPCLSVHDSLICMENDEAVAIGLMLAASTFYLGSPLPVDGSDGVEADQQPLGSELFEQEREAAGVVDRPLGLRRLMSTTSPVEDSEREQERRRRSSKKQRRQQERLEEEMRTAVIL